VQLPDTIVPVVSGPLYVSAGRHEAMPEVTSLPLQPTESGDLNHPAAFGAGADAASVTGGVESYLNETAAEDVLPALSVQLPTTDVPVVSGSA
jgi:hypothetical protein